MSKIEIELNDAGIREMLKSPGVQAKLQETANSLNVLYDGVRIYATRAAIHKEKDNDNRKDN